MWNDLFKSLFWCYVLSAVAIGVIVFVLFTMEWWKRQVAWLMDSTRTCTMSCWNKVKSVKFKSKKKSKKGSKGKSKKGKKGRQRDHDPIF